MKRFNITLYFVWISALLLSSCKTSYKEFSGVYPHLAYYNGSGECGTGAVVPWGKSLWVVTYSPHSPFGSDDKLYEINKNLEIIIHPESIGGTPANRMIHKESNQLFIGPYVIDAKKNVRVLPWEVVPGRHTAMARHLNDPENRILLGTMEAGFYDIDVHSLRADVIYKDGNVLMKEEGIDQYCSILPGYHGKGFYSGQGVAVFANNGEEGALAKERFDIPSGSLSEWDGKQWTVIRRNQFTEVTGPGGIYGNNSNEDPIWSLGWDYRSVILAVREYEKGWSYFRLPKTSYSYDGAHGWNTEWPRIRNIGQDYLMTMHGMFWCFPKTFSSSNSAGIRPRGAYLKIIGDFCKWNNKLVFGCDDAAKNVFLNSRGKHCTNTGQSNSNLWFTPLDGPDNVGPVNASGSLWLRDSITENIPSDPFLFQGWKYRCAWLANHSSIESKIKFEIDKKGNNEWDSLMEVYLKPNSSLFVPFKESDLGIWIRAVSSNDIVADLSFVFAQEENRKNSSDEIFDGLCDVSDLKDETNTEIIMYGLPDNRKSLGLLDKNNHYYEIDGKMNFEPKEDTLMTKFIRENISIEENNISIEENSILVIDSKGRRWRLPYGDNQYLDKKLRVCREVTTERNIVSLFGTFYELPAENADGYAKIRPISSHHYAISDFTSYRGLLVMSGINQKKYNKYNSHIVTSSDQKISIWAGVVDDLWKLGKPVGTGGPWYNSNVVKNVPSDPFLIGYYDDRYLQISHNHDEDITISLEVDPTGDGQWFKYIDIDVPVGHTADYQFPKNFQARWIRLRSDKSAIMSAVFSYK